MTSLIGKTVLITGAAGGFGREMIRQFAEAGCRLVLSDLSTEILECAVRETGIHKDCVVGLVVADLSEPANIPVLYENVKGLGALIDVLVNNAGIATIGPFQAVPQQRCQTLLQVNLMAPIQLSHCFLPDMLARGSGHIANISSTAGLVAVPGLAAYCGTKFGLRGFSEALAADVRKRGVQVSAIYPFFARTPMLDSQRYGGVETQPLPERFIYEPGFIVQQLIRGIRKNQLHIYPGMMPRLVWWLSRYAPWLLRLLFRDMLKSEDLPRDD